MAMKSTNFSKAKFMRQQSMRRYHFAKYCNQHRHKLAPSGKTWGKVFEEKEGLTLDEFIAKVKAYEASKR